MNPLLVAFTDCSYGRCAFHDLQSVCWGSSHLFKQKPATSKSSGDEPIYSYIDLGEHYEGLRDVFPLIRPVIGMHKTYEEALQKLLDEKQPCKMAPWPSHSLFDLGPPSRVYLIIKGISEKKPVAIEQPDNNIDLLVDNAFNTQRADTKHALKMRLPSGPCWTICSVTDEWHHDDMIEGF
ncbi:hypothetical protein CPB83DRAFT_901414 [Crepidotus variabilis]|uniref:Uncharacterized protein n=1 Tax=Crepidotus variabilis TaxID=179855 RepID=A0A9P6EUV4_9AGAR|nr:hypothetical protein CPB83DRAFT_901414 [Crepidotus variabilis]